MKKVETSAIIIEYVCLLWFIYYIYMYALRTVYDHKSNEKKPTLSDVYIYIYSIERTNECHFICKTDEKVSSDSVAKHAHLIFIRKFSYPRNCFIQQFNRSNTLAQNRTARPFTIKSYKI